MCWPKLPPILPSRSKRELHQPNPKPPSNLPRRPHKTRLPLNRTSLRPKPLQMQAPVLLRCLTIQTPKPDHKVIPNGTPRQRLMQSSTTAQNLQTTMQATEESLPTLPCHRYQRWHHNRPDLACLPNTMRITACSHRHRQAISHRSLHINNTKHPALSAVRVFKMPPTALQPLRDRSCLRRLV